MFSVVIPVYNRLKNLSLCLAALQMQHNPPQFEIIIADDGSTDGLYNHYGQDSVILCDNNIRVPIRYISCGPHNGFRPHRTRNIGIAQARHPYTILLDSDVLLNREALRLHKELRDSNPSVVVIGMYHFAESNQLTYDAILEDYENVRKLVPDRISAGPPTAGWDCRREGFTEDKNKIIIDYDGLGFFGGNQCWPVELFWKLGGYDEGMPSGMGEDAELGQRMRLAKLPVLQYAPVYGIHLPHERDITESQKLVQKSIHYIDKKYGIGTYATLTDPVTDPREKDLSLWYTRASEAIIVKKSDELTVFAVDGTRKWYVGIPSPDWLDLLEFSFADVKTVGDDFFKGMTYQGTIRK